MLLLLLLLLFLLTTPTNSSDEGLLNYCSLLCLILLRNGVQFLKPSSVSESNDQSSQPIESIGKSSDSSIASDVLSHLCLLVDNTDTRPIIQTLARDIIKEGVVVFFPGTKARKKYLLEMVNMILTGEQPSSWWLKFEALCSYFSQKDNNSLLELNWNVDKVSTHCIPLVVPLTVSFTNRLIILFLTTF